MKTILRLLMRDLRSIVRHPAAALIVAGLCLMPSLYAWINLYACWDPYAHTDRLPVAVVNLDEGAVQNGRTIRVGQAIVQQLRKNPAIHWVFTDAWQGNYGLSEGKYYALLEIPAGFSRAVASIATAAPTKPEILYRVSEKENAIAEKITGVAADRMAETVKSSFVETVNQQVLTALGQKQGDLTRDKSNLLALRDTLRQVSADTTQVENYLADTQREAAQMRKALQTTKQTLPAVSRRMERLQTAVQAGIQLHTAARRSLDEAGDQLRDGLLRLRQEADGLAVSVPVGADTSRMQALLRQVETHAEALDTRAAADEARLQGLTQMLPQTRKGLQELAAVRQRTVDVRRAADDLKKMLATGAPQQISRGVLRLQTAQKQVLDAVAAYGGALYDGTLQALDAADSAYAAQMHMFDTVLTQTRSVLPQLDTAASGLASLSETEAETLRTQLSALRQTLHTLQTRTSLLTEQNLDALLRLMDRNPEQVAAFLASPIEVKQVELYHGGTFGEGLTPFYTALAIWVGALLTCALLSVRSSAEGAGLIQQHFAKMLLFFLIAGVQTGILVTGERLLLGVSAANTGLFYALALLCALVFTTMIFTLVSLFGNVGKAAAVVMMVFQIAGAGGIYPIQTNPHIFGVLQPLWPFTYAIGAFREALAGPTWETVYHDAEALLAFGAAFLALAVLKRPLHRANERFGNKFRQARL